MCYKNNTTRLRRPATTAMIVAAAFAAVAAQTPAPPPSSTRATEFLDRLKQAVDAADRRTVSSMVSYPLTVLASGFNIPVKDAATFSRMYQSVMTPELRCAIVASEITAATDARRAAIITPDGLWLVDGAVWAPFKDGRYRITRLRVPPPAASVAGRTAIERVTFAESPGERSAAFAGWLIRQNVDVFVVTLKKGETLQARIDGFRGHDATLRVSPWLPTSAQPPAPLPDIGRNASMLTAAAGDYRVEVGHRAPYCDPPQRYKLTITISR